MRLETGEAHWAYDELVWWAHMGIEKRHRLMTDDMQDREKERARNVAGRSVM